MACGVAQLTVGHGGAHERAYNAGMRPHPDDPTYAAEQVSSLVARQLPWLASASVEHLARGWDCDVFAVGGEHVARLSRNLTAARGLVQEAALLPLLSTRLSLPIPQPVGLGSIDDAPDMVGAVYQLLPGTPLCAIELEPSDYDELAPTMGTFLAALHAARLPDTLVLPDDVLARFDPAQRSAGSRAALDQLEWEGGLTRGQCRRLQQGISEVDDHTLSSTRVLVHADLHPCNLLVDEDGFCGVLDWIDAHLGHPAADLATAYMNFPEASRGALFAAYGRVEASTLAWARWRAITVLTATVTGAQARSDGLLAHRSVGQLRQLARE